LLPKPTLPQRQFKLKYLLSPVGCLICIETFYLYTNNSNIFYLIPRINIFYSYKQIFFVDFPIKLMKPPTHPLHPIKKNNTCPACITAAAGTGLC